MPPEASTAADWLGLARHELAFLGTLADEYPDMVLFHAQQVLEKAIKAVIWSVDSAPPFTHSIEALLARVPEHVTIPETISRSVWLSEVYFASRYFADEPVPDPAKVAEGRKAAQAAVDWATDFIGL